MNCKLACHLMDDYLENRLSRYDRQRLEMHLGSCARCSEELRKRSSFERTMWQSLAASLQHRTLSSEASTRIVYEAHGTLERSIRMNRARAVAQAFGGGVAAVLVLIGLLFWFGSPALPSQLGPVTFLPVGQPSSSGVSSVPISPIEPVDGREPEAALLPTEDRLPLTLKRGEYIMEPRPLVPGGAFTVTVFLQSDLSEPLETARFDLDIDGPTGYYRFALSARGPLAPQGLTVLQVTSDALAGPCEEKYLISPTEIFEAPGTYTVRVALPGLETTIEP